MDKPGTRHRLMFDTTAPAAVASAIFYANTYYAANKSGYGLDPQQLGLMIVLRHIATQFGYNDAIWAAHGAFFAGALQREGAQARRAPPGNPPLSPTPASDMGAPQGTDGGDAPLPRDSERNNGAEGR